MSQINSTTTSPLAGPRKSPTSSLSGSRDSSPSRRGSEEMASSPVLSPSVATVFDASLVSALDITAVVGGSGSGAVPNAAGDRRESLLEGTADASRVATRRRSGSIVGDGVDGSPRSEKGSPEGAADTSESRDRVSPFKSDVSYGGFGVDGSPSSQMDSPEVEIFADEDSPNRVSEEAYGVDSPLQVSTTKSALKPSSRLSVGSTDSSYGLSPDVIDMKQRLRTQTTDQGVRAKLFEAPSPEILRQASQILKQREADHEASKDALRVELVSLRQEIAELTSEKRELLQAKEAVLLQITDYDSRLFVLSSELTRGAAELKALESKYTKTKAILTGQADALASEVREKQEQKEVLERSLQALDAEKSFLEKTHRGKIEELEGQYSERQAGLAASVAALESQLSGARSQILEQDESVADMSRKHHSTLEKNKALETEKKALEKANKGFLRTQANAISESEQLRSELADQKMLVAKLQWVIANPSQDISEFPTAKVAHEPAPAPEGRKSLSFGATPKGLRSKARQSAAFAKSSLGASPISGEDDASAALLNRSETEEPITSTLPRQESLESVLSSTTVLLTVQQKREAQEAKDTLEREAAKAKRAAKKK